MKELRRRILASILLVVLSSCHELPVDQMIDQNAPFITLSTVRKKLISDTIRVRSAKHTQLIKFLQSNSSGWETTFASYGGSLSIHQGDFHMTLLDNGVVISFVNQEGESKQLTKTVDPTQLTFLRN